MDDFNVEISEFYLQDLSSLKDTHISVLYRYKNGDTKKTYHQFEVETIVSVPEKRSCKIMGKFRDGENAYSLTLNKNVGTGSKSCSKGTIRVEAVEVEGMRSEV